MHRGGDLAAVVQKPGELEFIPLFFIEREIRERALIGCDDGIGNHHRQHRHALAVAARVRRFVVDRCVNEADKGFEQVFELIDQLPVGERDRGLGGERFNEMLLLF